MPKQAKIAFIQALQNEPGEPVRFAMFRCADAAVTHIMNAKGFWQALPEDDDAATLIVRRMMTEHTLPAFREDADDPSTVEAD